MKSTAPQKRSTSNDSRHGDWSLLSNTWPENEQGIIIKYVQLIFYNFSGLQHWNQCKLILYTQATISTLLVLKLAFLIDTHWTIWSSTTISHQASSWLALASALTFYQGTSKIDLL